MLVVGEGGLAVTHVLALGAHSDDIEIGCAGTISALLERQPDLGVTWIVLSADDAREAEARESAERLLAGADAEIRIERFRERYFPHGPGLKEYFDELGATVRPDLVLTHWRGDAHQDHRTVAELTANTFRDHLILEYEIPKTDGDLGTPPVYVQLTERQAAAKVAHLMAAFPSQLARPWYSEETFRAIMRLRGIEANAPDGWAEAFHARKVVLA